MWIVDDALIPTEKFLQEERERQEKVHPRDGSLIDWSTIHDSHRTNLRPLTVVRKEMLFARTKESYSASRERDILPGVAMRINLEDIVLCKISQAPREKCHVISLACGIQ